MSRRWPLLAYGPQWVRVMGWGVRYIDHREQRPLFSERNGHRITLHIGTHCFMVIKP